MGIIECLIVEDEPIARDLLVQYCSYIPGLNIAGICENALQARKYLESASIDLLLLDIHLPVLDGIQFLKTLKHPPVVIFTTAYEQYAVRAFELTACDYLVKPFLLDRFIIAIDKAKAMLRAKQITAADGPIAQEEGFFIRTDGKLIRVKFHELVYVEASGNYSKLYTTDGMLVPNMAFSALEKMLPGAIFKRAHRSFLINASYVSLIEGNRVFLGKYEVPIGSSYRDGFLKALGI
ncbi:LytTR family DNA-binding domain-containing protein [Flavihumibacter sp. CACIAM 22H1]|uniref:LytR/AlgR family response regulator transcription factor n=1 Tax=Flavihumibacter sp. CACIAM 22H1 TaxID=1812911 RepID=UPI0007A808BD|nr:LytTR family DNA-binding domain-containing protein [Flavihumibacter sp. CACIAM 22H1]KYP14125.1 MAG: DNA-binding response regulator [Flavihumibacter sp. CACIAM 22H1]